MLEIALESISKTYNSGLFKRKVHAVRDLSLAIYAGEVFGLVGPNGAGKSSTIRMILGMSRPDHGQILFRGTPVQKSDFRKHAGYLPENPYIYDHLNLIELLNFCGRTSGLDSRATQERGRTLMEQLQLMDARSRPLRTFSKGMMQRAGICFSLLHDPSVVILDEPMSGLDPLGRQMVFDLVLELKSQGKTVFFCSHILNDVERLCDRIGIMVGGELVKTLERAEFADNTQDRVHLLLNEEQGEALLNDLPGQISHGKDGVLLTVEASQLANVTATLAAAGVSIKSLQVSRFSLEELFVSAVKEHAA